MRAFFETDCDSKLASCFSKSSADPPGGNNKIPAAIRLAASNTPTSARRANCGFLKFLSIVHHESKLVDRLLLRRRLRALRIHRSEQRRLIQLIQKNQNRPRLLRADLYIQHDFVVRRNLRQPYRDDARLK